MKNFVRAAMGAVFLTSAVFSMGTFAQTGNPGGAINDNLGAMDYGVCRGTDPACYHDWERPEGWDSEWRVLLFTKPVDLAMAIWVRDWVRVLIRH